MDRKEFKALMKLLDIETTEILGDAAFAVEVVKLERPALTWLAWEQRLRRS